MKSVFWLDKIPLWGVFFLTVVIVLISIWLGTVLGNLRRRQPEHEAEAPLGTITGATLGLLAFMLAFTFGIAAERLNTRKQLLLDEVNTIQTAYMRAGLLLEPHRSETRKLILEYINIRADFAEQETVKQLKILSETISRAEAIQNRLWSHAVALAEKDRSSEIDALFISSINELIALHNSRITVFRYHIPTTIWHVLYFITILTMLIVGYQAGMAGKSSLKIGIVLALTFSVVVFLIADLDRASEGSLQVSQGPMLELQKKLQNSMEQQDKYELIVPEK